MQEKKIQGEPPLQPNRVERTIRINLEEAYQAAFRPLILANYLLAIREKRCTPEEVSHITTIVELALKLHLPLPKGFEGDTVAIKRLGMFKAEASISHISPILEAIRKRLKLPPPKEKEVPKWMIRSFQNPITKVQRERKTSTQT